MSTPVCKNKCTTDFNNRHRRLVFFSHPTKKCWDLGAFQRHNWTAGCSGSVLGNWQDSLRHFTRRQAAPHPRGQRAANILTSATDRWYFGKCCFRDFCCCFFFFCYLSFIRQTTFAAERKSPSVRVVAIERDKSPPNSKILWKNTYCTKLPNEIFTPLCQHAFLSIYTYIWKEPICDVKALFHLLARKWCPVVRMAVIGGYHVWLRQTIPSCSDNQSHSRLTFKGKRQLAASSARPWWYVSMTWRRWWFMPPSKAPAADTTALCAQPLMVITWDWGRGELYFKTGRLLCRCLLR